MQPTLYNEGQYNQSPLETYATGWTTQTTDGMSKATGLSTSFMKPYNTFSHLPYMTNMVEDGNTFVFMTTDLTHEPMLLQEPEYIPSQNVDNTKYDQENADRFILDGRELKIENAIQMAHYQTNMAAMIKLGEWFDLLREEGVYDNTRIILVSDHGRYNMHHEELILGGDDLFMNVELYNPLLMVKDFNAEGFTTDETFMTNADVPTLALEDLVENPINPFTGKEINNDEKFAHDQFITMSSDWNTETTTGNTFAPSRWASVKDNLWDPDNWTFYQGEVVLDEYKMP
jgi:hypothetical protein